MLNLMVMGFDVKPMLNLVAIGFDVKLGSHQING
jgi:hypothetical protein